MCLPGCKPTSVCMCVYVCVMKLSVKIVLHFLSSAFTCANNQWLKPLTLLPCVEGSSLTQPGQNLEFYSTPELKMLLKFYFQAVP